MMRFAMLVAVAVFSSAVSAGNCPVDMKAIDAALPKAKLDDKQAAEVK